MHSRSIAQTGYGGSGELVVNIIFNKSRDFISKKNELISDCFRVLFVQHDCLCRCRMVFYYWINSFIKIYIMWAMFAITSSWVWMSWSWDMFLRQLFANNLWRTLLTSPTQTKYLSLWPRIWAQINFYRVEHEHARIWLGSVLFTYVRYNHISMYSLSYSRFFTFREE